MIQFDEHIFQMCWFNHQQVYHQSHLLRERLKQLGIPWAVFCQDCIRRHCSNCSEASLIEDDEELGGGRGSVGARGGFGGKDGPRHQLYIGVK